jgi:hypothetical protein
MSQTITLSDIPKPAWIVLMILGFIIFWPIGLAILGYLWWSGKMFCGRKGEWHGWTSRMGATRSTGNMAFDSYREETLRRLDQEATEFREFVDRLKFAKDKEEFDRFMAERSRRAAEAPAA